jgi:hypothetical protein
MHTDDLFEAWKKQRMSSEVPPGFADRVMLRIAAHEAQRRQGTLTRLLLGLAASRRGRAAIMAVAVLLFVMRLASVLALFFNFRGIME